MSLRVLHLLDHSIPLHSGYTFRSLSLLREQRRLGWTTFHLTSPKQGEGLKDKASQAMEETIDGWHFYRTPVDAASRGLLPGLAGLRLMQRLEKRLLQVAEQVQPQILHVHSPVLNALPALRVGRRLGIPVVYEVRAFWEDAAVDHGTTREGSLRYRLTRSMETHALKRANHVFTICEGLRRDIVGRGVPPSKVTVIPNAVDIDKFEPGGVPDAGLKASLGLTGSTVLGFVGSFYAYEGLDMLLEALPKILRQRPEVRLLLVGGVSEAALAGLSGPELSALQRLLGGGPPGRLGDPATAFGLMGGRPGLSHAPVLPVENQSLAPHDKILSRLTQVVESLAMSKSGSHVDPLDRALENTYTAPAFSPNAPYFSGPKGLDCCPAVLLWRTVMLVWPTGTR